MADALPIVPALNRTLRSLARGARDRARLLALLGGSLVLLAPAAAAALTVYGAPRPLAGAGGCLREAVEQPAGDQACPGSAAGLAGAQAVAVSPDGASAYVAAGDDLVALARARATGTLEPAQSPSASACISAVASSPCAGRDAALSGADAVAVSPDGRFVYAGASNAAAVSAFVRARHGMLVPVAPTVRGPESRSQHDPIAYFGCVAGASLPGIPPAGCQARLQALNGVDALAVSPDGHYLYAVSSGLAPGKDSVVTLQRDPRTGGLRPLPGTSGCVQSLPGSGCPPLAGLEGASAITISPDGRFVYVASQLSGSVRGFARNRATGVLMPLRGRSGCIYSDNRAEGDVSCEEKVPQLAGARSIALSPDGRQLYVAAFDPGAVVVLGRNPTSGRLAVRRPECLQAASDARCPVGLPFLRGATALTMVPNGRIVYVISEGGNSLVELLRDPIHGTLTLASASQTAVDPLSGPAALALSPRGGSIYVASPFDEGVAALTG